MSVTLTTIKNAFEPDINVVEVLPWSPGGCLADYVADPDPGRSGTVFIFAVNGVSADLAAPIADGDKISVVPRVRATAAAAVATWATGATWAAATGWTALAWGATAAASLVGMAYVGSQIASALGADIPDSQSYENTQEFGWGALNPSYLEGKRIPWLFGTVKTTGHILQQFITIDGDNNERLHMLLGLCDHEIDSITDIRINDQAVSNFNDVTTETRLGALSETTSMTGFSEIRTQTSVNVMLTREEDNPGFEPVTRTTDGTAVEKLLIHLNLPNGLYYIGGGGGGGSLGKSTVGYAVLYRAVGDTEWIEATYPDGYAYPDGALKSSTIEAKTTEPLRRVVEIDNLTPNQYEFQVFQINWTSTSTKESRDLYFESFTEIVKEDLLYPGLAKYSIRALATNQLSGGVPNVSCLPSKTTLTLRGASRSMTNPAWICYALLNIYGGVADDRIVYEDFVDWADYCDEDVSGSPRFTCSTLITGGNLWDNLQAVARIGRATIIHRGAKYGVYCDKPDTVVSHLFTLGNIIDGSFSLQYLPQKDRANYVEIEYTDPDKDFTRQVVGIYDQDYLGDNIQQKTTVSFDAAIPRAQAVREGAFLINSNNLLHRVVTFDADIYSFACIVGDLFYFQHEVVDYESINTGGRIVAAGSGYVQLDQAVHVGSSACKVMVELADGQFVERDVTTASGTTTDTLTISPDWGVGAVPAKYNQFLFGETDTYKKIYRLSSCEIRDDQTRTITGIEYNPAIYTDDNVVIEDVERPDWATRMPHAENVNAIEGSMFAPDGSLRTTVQMSWRPVYTLAATVWDIYLNPISTDGDVIRVAGAVTGTFYRITDYNFQAGDTYKLSVIARGEPVNDFGYNTAFVTIGGNMVEPTDVTGLTAVFDPVHHVINLGWNPVADSDFRRFDIRRGAVFDTATTVGQTPDNRFAYPVSGEAAGDITFWVAAVNRSGIYSEVPASVTISLDPAATDVDPPADLAWTSYSNIGNDGTDIVMMYITWSAVVHPDVAHYVVQITDDVTGKVSQFYTSDTQYQVTAGAYRSYTVAVATVDRGGNMTAFCLGVQDTTTKDATPPAVPTGLTASGTYTNIILSWSHGGEADLDHFEVYRSSTNDSATATVIGNAVKAFSGVLGMKTDTPPDSGIYYYFVKAVDSSGNASDFSVGDSAAAPGVTASVGPGSITATEIADNAITTPKIFAGAVGTDQLAANAVIASKIDVATLSAISANIGTVTAGRVQNAANTTYLDLTNNLFSLGGQLIWNGTSLTIGTGATIAGTAASTVVSNANGAFPAASAGTLAGLSSVSDAYITSISGSKITTGTISSATGSSYWNLNTNKMHFDSTGELSFYSTAFKIVGRYNGIVIYGGSSTLTVDSGAITLDSADEVFLDGYSEVAMRYRGSTKFRFGNGTFNPYSNNATTMGTSSLNFWDFFATNIYDGGVLQDVQDDLEVLQQIKGRTKDSFDPATDQLIKSDQPAIESRSGMEYMDLLSLPRWMTNYEMLKSEVMAENGSMITPEDFDLLIQDHDQLGWRLRRHAGNYSDLVSGGLRQLDQVVNGLAFELSEWIANVDARLKQLETV